VAIERKSVLSQHGQEHEVIGGDQISIKAGLRIRMEHSRCVKQPFGLDRATSASALEGIKVVLRAEG